ncbi:MAG: glycosyltransferase family 9 protein [Alphaproteobacteria bacterium]
MASTAVIQVKQGIGDVIWHLPFIRAIAAKTPEGKVTFLTLPSTRAQELLQAEPCIDRVIYFEHQGSEFKRAVNLAVLTALLRARKFERVWILDRTVRPALAAKLAGIPERIGPGDAAQRWLLTNEGIAPHHFRAVVTDWLRVFVESMGVPVATTEPDLKLPDAPLAAVRERYAAAARPWIVLGLGGSHMQKDWPDDNWAAFLDTLRRRAGGTVVLIGGPDNTARADALISRSTGAPAINACDLAIVEAAALLRLADLFVGPDSGPMNLAAAGATPAFGLFGSTPVLSYSKYIHAIEPDGGPSADGMRRITPTQVMARIEPYLEVKPPAP